MFSTGFSLPFIKKMERKYHLILVKIDMVCSYGIASFNFMGKQLSRKDPEYLNFVGKQLCRKDSECLNFMGKQLCRKDPE